jgi:low temperature requirement protein LtrA
VTVPPPHRRRRFGGRDPHEAHRTATPLELLYDLTLVVAFGIAADELAHYVADDHAAAGVVGFAFSVFAVAWAWINYSWFASAYDTDDWVFRVATMVQMAGVVVLALGLPEVFASIDHGDTLDNDVVVAGYVVMRASQVVLWALASRHDTEHAAAARAYMWSIGSAQVGWVALALADLPVAATFALASVLYLIELSGPVVAQRRRGGTPWHAHHIAERYGLLVIITLGEGVIGTVAAMNAVVHGPAGWTVDAALVLVAGIGLTFGAWWMYFAVPWADVLARHRERSFGWGYGHLVVFAGLAGIGAGLHVAAYFLEHEAKIGATATVASVAVPVAVFAAAYYAIYASFVRHRDPFHALLGLGTVAVLAAGVALAAAGVGMPVALLVLMLAPLVTVVGFETVGHRHMAAALDGG